MSDADRAAERHLLIEELGATRAALQAQENHIENQKDLLAARQEDLTDLRAKLQSAAAEASAASEAQHEAHERASAAERAREAALRDAAKVRTALAVAMQAAVAMQVALSAAEAHAGQQAVRADALEIAFQSRDELLAVLQEELTELHAELQKCRSERTTEMKRNSDVRHGQKRLEKHLRRALGPTWAEELLSNASEVRERVAESSANHRYKIHEPSLQNLEKVKKIFADFAKQHATSQENTELARADVAKRISVAVGAVIATTRTEAATVKEVVCSETAASQAAVTATAESFSEVSLAATAGLGKQIEVATNELDTRNTARADRLEQEQAVRDAEHVGEKFLRAVGDLIPRR